jgi:hypothetical protein
VTEQILLWMILLLCVSVFIHGFFKLSRLVQFPFLTAAAFLAYLFPQLYAAVYHQQFPEAAVAKTLLMTILCLLAAFLGYTTNRKPATLGYSWRFNYRRLIYGCILLTLVGAYFFYKVSVLAPTFDDGRLWSGPITIYVFFGQLLIVGVVLALILHISRPSWITLSISLLGLLFYLHRGIMVGRRTALAEFFLMAGLAAYLKYRWVPPRILVFIILVSGALWINAIGDYRSELTQNERLSAPILSIDYIGNMKQAFTNAPDINNAVYAIDAVDRDFSLNFGLGLYDTIIFRYVPGQLIGYDVKKGLQSQFELDYDLSYNFHTGTTSTGMGWAFQTFWYFGVLWFFIIGLLMSRWFLAATRGGIVAAMILILTYYQSLAAFSFGPAGFFLRLIFLCFSLFPVLLFAKLPGNAIQRFPRAPEIAGSQKV